MKKIVLLTILFAAFLMPQNVKALEGFYVGATGAANFLQNTGSGHHHGSGRRHHQNYETGYFGALALGYRWCNDFSLEAEVAYRYNEGKKHHRHYGDFDGSHHRRHRGHRDVWAAMVNVLYDIDMCWCVEPYVGVGIGYANVRHENERRHFGGSHRRHHRDDNNFAYQVIAGVAYPICDNIELAVEYRFFGTTTSRRHERDIYNHDIGVNLKYFF